MNELAACRGRLEEFAGDVFAPLVRAGQQVKGGLYLRGLLLDGRRKEGDEPLHDGVLNWSEPRDRLWQGEETASNRRDEQEIFVLCLRILQSALVYANTLMLQDILGELEWVELLTPADRRGLTPLFRSHVRPYGEVNPDMARPARLR
ncbi:Tn3 family transposase [Streptomyces sp. NBC_01237]|uniref:Tn3 family transposase n=1 Tax=Streptomyces sp. NBC_01237 TaxID=2903790 RepID=UPI002DD95D3E|nr:Tn3 family transposase [Streptomyces sp. NBC_01237]WRZ77740.1 transposase [Streptomyces sp. NBC_01237]